MAALSFEDGKTGLTKTNLFKQAHAHYTADPNLEGQSLVTTLTSLLNKRTHYVTITFLTGPGGVLRRDACEAFWSNINGHELTENDVENLFFGTRTRYKYGTRDDQQRYYSPPSPVHTTETENSLGTEEGFLSEQHPDPSPKVTVENMSPFVRRLYERGRTGASSEEIRPTSEKSSDSESNSDDRAFIDDGPVARRNRA